MAESSRRSVTGGNRSVSRQLVPRRESLRDSRQARYHPAEGHPACAAVARCLGNTGIRRTHWPSRSNTQIPVLLYDRGFHIVVLLGNGGNRSFGHGTVKADRDVFVFGKSHTASKSYSTHSKTWVQKMPTRPGPGRIITAIATVRAGTFIGVERRKCGVGHICISKGCCYAIPINGFIFSSSFFTCITRCVVHSTCCRSEKSRIF